MISRHRLDNHSSAEDVLQRVGGLEIAAMVGAMLQAAANGQIFIVDGFIATAAYAIAEKMQAEVHHYAVFSHCSNEQGHRTVLNALNRDNLLELNMALGEGTGAVLALPLLDAACAFMRDMASFADAGVSEGR